MRCWKGVVVLAAALLTGCAQLPEMDPGLIASLEAKGPEGHLELLREESEKIGNAPFHDGNSVQLLQNGPAVYDAMARAIRVAHRRIDMESYIFDQYAGARFAKFLIAARKRGVEVNLIYDAWGSQDTPGGLFNYMCAQGIHVLAYHPLSAESVLDFSINRRDHRKLLVIDGKVAFIGGINISDEYDRERQLGVSGVNPLAPMRDTDVRIEGPAVSAFEWFFMQDWRSLNGPPLDPPAAIKTAKGDLPVQVVDGAPGYGEPSIYLELLAMIELARTSVHLTSAFFVPPPPLAHALERAARRGVDVKLIVPDFETPIIAFEAGRAYYEDLMEAGVKIYERQGVILHAKTVIIDGVWSTIGSSNLDWRSVLFNEELNAVILGRSFGNQMETAFQNDLAQSRQLTPDQWDNRPFLEAVEQQLSRIVEIFL